jgi:hypothetical protein
LAVGSEEGANKHNNRNRHGETTCDCGCVVSAGAARNVSGRHVALPAHEVASNEYQGGLIVLSITKWGKPEVA